MRPKCIGFTKGLQRGHKLDTSEALVGLPLERRSRSIGAGGRVGLISVVQCNVLATAARDFIRRFVGILQSFSQNNQKKIFYE